MTPNLEVVYHYIRAEYGLPIGVTNCRRISGSQTYSQHSWSNAGDIYTTNRDLQDQIKADLLERFPDHVRNVLSWRYNAAHWNHVHVDMWPKGWLIPPCAGGAQRIKYKDGTVEYAPFPLTIKEDDMPLNELDKTTVDIAYALGAAGQRTYWYGLDRDSQEFKDLAAAVRRNANTILDRITDLEQGGGNVAVDPIARNNVNAAHDRLDKLHTV